MVISGGKPNIMREKWAECLFARHECYVNPPEMEPYAVLLEASARPTRHSTARRVNYMCHTPLNDLETGSGKRVLKEEVLMV
jgi:hypothetical protein